MPSELLSSSLVRWTKQVGGVGGRGILTYCEPSPIVVSSVLELSGNR